MRRFEKYLLLGLLIYLAYSCKHTYDPPKLPFSTRILVVSGLINVGQDVPTSISLSRAQSLSDTNLYTPELGASVSLEQQNGPTYILQSQDGGNYLIDHLNLDPSYLYRLNITTSDGVKYNSDFVPAKKAPAIDSLTWEQDKDVTIYVYTHDPTNSTIYYRWDYTETWNYMSNIQTPWGIVGRHIFAKDSLTQTDSCWRTSNSTDIILGSSQALSNDVISHQPVTTIPQNDEKISKRYSILVRQYALTKDAYQFHQILFRNTEQTGSLYDPQPSQLSTNLHCLTNPDQPVIGFVSASSVEEKRIFIKHQQVNDWVYPGVTIDCTPVFTFQDPNDFTIFDYPDTTYGPYYFQSGGGMVVVKRSCTDCKYWGGTNVKPSFWND